MSLLTLLQVWGSQNRSQSFSEWLQELDPPTGLTWDVVGQTLLWVTLQLFTFWMLVWGIEWSKFA